MKTYRKNAVTLALLALAAVVLFSCEPGIPVQGANTKTKVPTPTERLLTVLVKHFLP